MKTIVVVFGLILATTAAGVAIVTAVANQAQLATIAIAPGVFG